MNSYSEAERTIERFGITNRRTLLPDKFEFFLIFVGGERLALDRVNVAQLIHLFGDDPREWSGKQVRLCHCSFNLEAVAVVGDVREAHARGVEDRKRGTHRRAVPSEFRSPERVKEALAWVAGWDGEPPPDNVIAF